MIVYIAVYISSYFFLVVDKLFGRVPVNARPGFYLSIFVLFIIGGLRDGGGVDYESYVRIFNVLGNDSYTSNKIERGYYYLNYYVKELGFDAHFLIGLCFIVSTSLIFVVIRRYSASPSLSLVVLFGAEIIFMLQNTIRQGLAVSICFFSIKFLLDRKPILFFMSVCFASTFHLSASLFLFSYVLHIFNIRFLRWLMLAVLLMSFYFYFNDNFILQITVFFNDLVFDGRYSNIIYDVISQERGRGFRPFIYLLFASGLLFLCFSDRLSPNSEIIIFITIIGFSINTIFNGFPVLHRLSHYFMIFSVISIPMLVSFWKQKINNSVAYICCIIIYSILFLRVLHNDGHEIFPYKSLIL